MRWCVEETYSQKKEDSKEKVPYSEKGKVTRTKVRVRYEVIR